MRTRKSLRVCFIFACVCVCNLGACACVPEEIMACVCARGAYANTSLGLIKLINYAKCATSIYARVPSTQASVMRVLDHTRGHSGTLCIEMTQCAAPSALLAGEIYIYRLVAATERGQRACRRAQFAIGSLGWARAHHPCGRVVRARYAAEHK